jgi:hypothetical protein
MAALDAEAYLRDLPPIPEEHYLPHEPVTETVSKG